MALSIVFMSIYPLIKIAGGGSGNISIYLDTAFWPLASLTLVLSTGGVSLEGLDRFFRFVFAYALLSNAIEVTLFLTTGRLPAMAYANSWLVRFGGFLDDPNGFAALLFMLMGWAYFHFTGMRRFAAEVALMICVFLTQSLSALGFLALLIVFFAVQRFIRKPKPLLALGISISIAAFLLYVWSPLADAVTAIIELRQGSIDDHLAQVTVANMSSSLDWLFGIPEYLHYESWWVGSLVNFGAPWFVLSAAVVATLAWSVAAAFLRAQDRQMKAFLSGVLLLSAYFIVGNANLPFFHIFPISFLFFCFSFLVFFEKIRER
jgi:hypothetical protein